MHGRGCSHDMGAGRNFWVSGQASVAPVRPIGIKLSLLLVGALRMLLAGRGTELKAKLTQKGGKYLPTASQDDWRKS